MHRVTDLPALEPGSPPCAPTPTRLADTAVAQDLPPTSAREAELLAYTTRASDELAVADAGAGLMRALTDQSRLSLLVRHHATTLAVLLEALGSERTEAVLTEFLAASPASAWRDEQSRAFTTWLATRPELVAVVG